MKLKILCLHGKEQTAEIMRTRLGRLPHWSREVAEFSYLDAPHLLPKKDGNDVAGRYWFGRTPAGDWDQPTLNTSLEALRDTWVREGPFSGILAFSQGGTFATLAASIAFPSSAEASALAYPTFHLPGLKFVISFGAPDLAKWPVGNQIAPTIKSQHFGGKTDVIVPIQSSLQLAQRYLIHEFHEHEQGHCIPMKRPLMNIVIDFITAVKCSIDAERVVTATTAVDSSDGSIVVEQPAPLASKEITRLCGSDSVAEQQATEIETLFAIFNPNEISLVRPAPTRSGDPTGCISITLLPPSEQDDNWFCSDQLQLRFEMSEHYPDIPENPLQIQLQTGTLSLLQFSIAMRKALLSTLSSIASEDGNVYACVEAAKEWILSGAWRHTQKASQPQKASDGLHVENNIEGSGSTSRTTAKQPATVAETCDTLTALHEESEEQTAYMINIATKEANKTAANYLYAKLRANSGSTLLPSELSTHEGETENIQSSLFGSIWDEIQDAEKQVAEEDAHQSLTSSKGKWNYIIGLVGKPSAGKSSFYNAATQACFSKDGRKMAAVAAHPFTTIEPNIGPGFYPGPIDCPVGANRGALYGRDSAGRRLLPVVIKDVAGLVPGAYKGRGKGNQFLADLCDADVLIHVVDATGKSDKDGNVISIQRDAIATSSSSSLSNNSSTESEFGFSSPSEDCKWVREELHRWIHGNVKAKWSSVTRKSKDKHIDRVVALFSGYQGSKSFTYRALHRANITNASMLATLSALDLHKLVAHFLSIRFPTVLALNKIDDFDSPSEGVRAIQTCMNEAVRRGELAVPVCARAENWIQLKQACKLHEDSSDSSSSDVSNLKLSLKACESIGLVTENDMLYSTSADQETQTAASSTRIMLPTVGSKVWNENEAIVSKILSHWSGTGVMDTLSSAVYLNPPVLCYPVCDLDSEMPMGWTPGEGGDKEVNMKLRDCILLKPGSTVYHVFDSLKKGALSHVIVHGDFVRAEGKSIDVGTTKKRQLGRDDEIIDDCSVIRIQTNRKSVWQQQFATFSGTH